MGSILVRSNFSNSNYVIVTFAPIETVDASKLQDGEEARPIENNGQKPLFFQGFTRPPVPPDAPKRVVDAWHTIQCILWTEVFTDLLPGSGFFNEQDALRWRDKILESTPCEMMTRTKARDLF